MSDCTAPLGTVCADPACPLHGPQLPKGVMARIDVFTTGVRVNLRQGMTAKEFADMLRLIADAYEQGTIQRRPPQFRFRQEP